MYKIIGVSEIVKRKLLHLKRDIYLVNVGSSLIGCDGDEIGFPIANEGGLVGVVLRIAWSLSISNNMAQIYSQINISSNVHFFLLTIGQFK